MQKNIPILFSIDSICTFQQRGQKKFVFKIRIFQK